MHLLLALLLQPHCHACELCVLACSHSSLFRLPVCKVQVRLYRHLLSLGCCWLMCTAPELTGPAAAADFTKLLQDTPLMQQVLLLKCQQLVLLLHHEQLLCLHRDRAGPAAAALHSAKHLCPGCGTAWMAGSPQAGRNVQISLWGDRVCWRAGASNSIPSQILGYWQPL